MENITRLNLYSVFLYQRKKDLFFYTVKYLSGHNLFLVLKLVE